MKKRVSKLVVLGFVLVGVLTGCGKTIQTTKVEKEDKIAVNVWYSGGKTAAGVFEDIIQEFNKTQDKYEVVGVTQGDYDETYEKLQAAIAGKNAPSVVLLDGDKTHNLNEKGLLESLQAFVEKDETFEKNDFIEVFYNQCLSPKGELYSLPIYGTTQIMYYNKKGFEEAGISSQEIKTWQDLEEAAKRMTKKSGDKVSFYGWEPMYGEDNLIDMAFSNGGDIFSQDKKNVTINEEAWVESWESIRKWIHEDQIMRIHFGGQGWQYWYDTMDDVLQDRAGGYTGSSGDQADLDFSIVGAMEQPGFHNHKSTPVARALQLAIPKGGKNQAKQGAYEFIKFFTSPKNQGIWSMKTGYVPVRKSVDEEQEYKAYLEKNPQAKVPIQQSLHATVLPIDPTGGKVYDALKIAADQVEVENVLAQKALDEAQRVAQKALDEYYSSQK